MRNFILALILFLGVVFIIARFAEVKAIGEILQQGDIHVKKGGSSLTPHIFENKISGR